MNTAHKEASDKVNNAAAACSAAQASWSAAANALAGTVGVNGYGIFRERFELRDKLASAREHLDAALKTLDQINWPTEAEYDQL